MKLVLKPILLMGAWMLSVGLGPKIVFFVGTTQLTADEVIYLATLQ
jgi:hypothetical protein